MTSSSNKDAENSLEFAFSRVMAELANKLPEPPAVRDTTSTGDPVFMRSHESLPHYLDRVVARVEQVGEQVAADGFDSCDELLDAVQKACNDPNVTSVSGSLFESLPTDKGSRPIYAAVLGALILSQVASLRKECEQDPTSGKHLPAAIEIATLLQHFELLVSPGKILALSATLADIKAGNSKGGKRNRFDNPINRELFEEVLDDTDTTKRVVVSSIVGKLNRLKKTRNIKGQNFGFASVKRELKRQGYICE